MSPVWMFSREFSFHARKHLVFTKPLVSKRDQKDTDVVWVNNLPWGEAQSLIARFIWVSVHTGSIFILGKQEKCLCS